jgi:hypothetical protein
VKNPLTFNDSPAARQLLTQQKAIATPPMLQTPRLPGPVVPGTNPKLATPPGLTGRAFPGHGTHRGFGTPR